MQGLRKKPSPYTCKGLSFDHKGNFLHNVLMKERPGQLVPYPITTSNIMSQDLVRGEGNLNLRPAVHELVCPSLHSLPWGLVHANKTKMQYRSHLSSGYLMWEVEKLWTTKRGDLNCAKLIASTDHFWDPFLVHDQQEMDDVRSIF